MKLNLKLIEDNFGKTVRDEIDDQIDLVLKNVEFLYKIGFRELDDIFYSFAIVFLQDEQKFQNKVLALCEKVGNNFVEILENNFDLWEEIF